MKILVVPDSYKGSLSSQEVASFMEEGILEADPSAQVVKIPMADGGEGTVVAMVSAGGGEYRELEVTGPLGEPVRAVYGLLNDGKTAVIEMASASGLMLVPEHRLNPMITTSYGTGELIKDALQLGSRKIVMGLGGSATNDGGVGMAQALGVRFLDEDGVEIGFGGGELHRIRNIDVTGLDPLVAGCEFIIASDVTNPLCGPNGAAYVFSPQKGATPEMVEKLDQNLKALGLLIHAELGQDVINLEGAGAAGGMGAGLIAFAKAKMARGIDIVLETAKFEDQVKDADLVLTGEGRTDSQTAYGKAPAGVAKLAKKHKKPVICISGGISSEVHTLYEAGMDVIIGATQSPMTLNQAIENSSTLIRHAAASVVRTYLLPHKYRQ